MSAPAYGVWQPIETAPRDGTEFACGWFFQGRFVTDMGKFYQRPNEREPRVIQARYRHRLDPEYWSPLPQAPIRSAPGTEPEIDLTASQAELEARGIA